MSPLKNNDRPFRRLRDINGRVGAVIDTTTNKLYIVPPHLFEGGDFDKLLRQLRKRLIKAEVEFIDMCDDFPICVPIEYYIEEMTFYKEDDVVQRLIKFKKRIMERYEKAFPSSVVESQTLN